MRRTALVSTTTMLAVACALAGAVLLVPGSASAQTYRWTDDRGNTFYGQGLDSVPQKYRREAVPLNFPSGPPAEAAVASEVMPKGELVRIPFKPGQRIMVDARVNGTGSVRLVLDTGADVTTINPTALSSLGVSFRDALRGAVRGVTGTADVLAVTIQTLEIGAAKVGPLRIVSHDSGSFAGDGLLGRDFLDHFQVSIDNAAGLVTLSAKSK
jgi:hypothetical protein